MCRLRFLLVIWFIAGFFFALIDRTDIAELADLTVKKARAIEAKRRILIIGGSNAFYGVDSAVLENKISLPVLNLSLPQEGGDPALMEAIALKYAKIGDLVLYSTLRYWSFGLKDLKTAKFIARRLQVEQYEGTKWYNMLDYFWRAFPRENTPIVGLKMLLSGTHRSENWFSKMNEYGDYIGCVKKGEIEPFLLKDADLERGIQFGDSLRAFKEDLDKKGATLVLLIPWILIKPSEIAGWVKYHQNMRRSIAANLKYVDMMDSLKIDSSLFCDHRSHLTRESASIRTRAFIVPAVKRAL